MSIYRILYKFTAVAVLWVIGLPIVYITMSFGLWTWSIYKWPESVREMISVLTLVFSIIVWIVSHSESREFNTNKKY